MGWFKDTFTPEPIECPRGWGPVAFVRKFVLVPPIVAIDRICPIGGVDRCGKCRYPFEPGSAERLRLRLEELEGLRGTTLTEAEFGVRRRLIIEAREPSRGTPGDREAAAALVLGPLGLVVTGAGWFLSSAVSLGFLSILIVGLVLVGLAVSFAGMSAMRRRALPGSEGPVVNELAADATDLEAELGRAQEELGFYRELHKGEPLGQPQSDGEGES